MEHLTLLRQFLKEEIGRNYHTINNDPITFDKLEDFDVEIYSQPDGFYYMTVFYKQKKLNNIQKFSSQDDAFNKARMIIDKARVEFMNGDHSVTKTK